MPKKTETASAPKISLLTSTASIEAAITKLHTTGQQLQADMHMVACSVLKHLGKHGDVRIVAKCVNAMPEMSRKNALMQWFTAFGPVVFDSKGAASYNKDGALKLGDAMAKPFWKFKANEGGAYEPIDINAYVNAQIKKLEKDAKETGRDYSALIMALKTVRPECDF